MGEEEWYLTSKSLFSANASRMDSNYAAWLHFSILSRNSVQQLLRHAKNEGMMWITFIHVYVWHGPVVLQALSAALQTVWYHHLLVLSVRPFCNYFHHLSEHHGIGEVRREVRTTALPHVYFKYDATTLSRTTLSHNMDEITSNDIIVETVECMDDTKVWERRFVYDLTLPPNMPADDVYGSEVDRGSKFM